MEKSTAGVAAGDALSSSPRVAVSWGECIDKITILEIKAERISAPEALANVRRELDHLLSVLAEAGPMPAGVQAERAALKSVNEKLWAVEDDIRDCEARQAFDAPFIALARSVYRLNDERGRIKRAINAATGSALVEEKHYRDYGAPHGAPAAGA